MVRMNPNELFIVNKNFNNFSKKALDSGAKSSQAYLISCLQKFEKSYKKMGVAEVFLQKAQQFAEDCYSNGLSDFTGIIYAFLIKIPNLPLELKEILIKRAIQIAKKQKDDIHELARVVDLKMLYKKTPNLPKKMYIKTLFEEGNVLKKIVRNYDESASHYKTVSRMISDKDLYKFRLGLNLVDIAKAVLRTDRKTAADKLYDARKIFKELGKDKELFFVDGLIEQLKR